MIFDLFSSTASSSSNSNSKCTGTARRRRRKRRRRRRRRGMRKRTKRKRRRMEWSASPFSATSGHVYIWISERRAVQEKKTTQSCSNCAPVSQISGFLGHLWFAACGWEHVWIQLLWKPGAPWPPARYSTSRGACNAASFPNTSFMPNVNLVCGK